MEKFPIQDGWRKYILLKEIDREELEKDPLLSGFDTGVLSTIYIVE